MHKKHHKYLPLFLYFSFITICIIIYFILNMYSLKLQSKTQILLLFLLSSLFGLSISISKFEFSKKIRFLTLCIIVIITSNISNEKRITNTIIMDNGTFIAQFASTAPQPKFYEPCYVFLKKEFQWDSKHELDLLENKYDMKFQLKSTTKDKRIYYPENHINTNIYIIDPPTPSNIYGTDTFSTELVTSLEQEMLKHQKLNIQLIETDNKIILLCPSSMVQEDFAKSVHYLIKKIQKYPLLKKSKVTIYYKIQDSGTQSELQTITINNTLTFLEAKEQNRRLSLKYLKSQIYILYYQLSKDVSSNTSDVL